MAFQTGLEDKPWYYGAIIGVLAAAGIYYGANKFLLKPKQATLAAESNRLTELQAKIQEGRTAQQQLPRFREEVRELELELEQLLRILPARRNTPELMRRIRQLTEQGDFDLLRFDPGEYFDREFYSEWPIAINLNGGYHELATLFDRISRLPRIINVENLRIGAVAGADSRHTITADFIAKTFVYKEDEAVAEE